MSFKSLWILSVLPLFWLLYQSHSTGLAILSPQGCRMSWMSPSYLVQDEFNTTWTPLARRYSLLLYREVGWDSETPSGRPVLFIPGNAGSSHQVRSIASSASRQFYSSPHVRSTDFPANVEPLDLYAVDFNEDLSALHGPTLQTQTAYVNAALEYIASKYPQKRNLQITLLGHSMGGIVALNALRSSRYIPLVSAVITMSSPHSLPPARLDQEIERTFSTSLDVVWNASSFDHSTGYSPPILALCGGATDNMLPMESCALPPPPAHIAPNAENLYRRTVFTSGLDGTWTGVGHREMVWCHQVRWRVARAALELAVSDPDARGAILDRWFAGIPGQSVPSQIISPNNPTIDVSADQLVSRQIPSGTIAYRFPATSVGQYLVVMLAQGRIAGIAPEKEVLSDARVDVCESSPHSEVVCKPAATKFVRLVPNPPLHSLFPIPGEGVDESEGVVVWEAEPLEVEGRYFVLTVASTGNAGSWLFAKIQSSGTADFVTYDNNKLTPFLGTTKLDLSSKTNSIRRVWLPNLVSNALVVYRAKFTHTGDCTDPLLAPILVHTSSNAESHFHRTIPSPDGVFLHTHSSGPFLGTKYGVNLTVYSSGECHVDKIEISVDWRSSVGRAASRLWAGVFAWAVATAAAMNTLAWYEWDGSRQFPTLQQSFERIVWRFAVLSLGGVTALGLLPLPSSFMLGLSGEPLFFILAPTSLAIAAATVGCSCYLLVALQWIFGKLYQTLTVLGLSTDTDTRRHPFTRSSAVFHVLLGVSVMVVIPYQVAYLVAFLLHLWECSISRVQLKRQNRDPNSVSSYAQACHLLLLLFWLLPLVAPVLIVWARTLINAGVTTPFDGDHNVLNVMFVVMCVELGGSRLPNKSSSLYRLSLAFSYLLLSLVAIVLGARYTYFLYIFFNMCCACFVIGTVGGGQAVSHP